jgi:hypothetical protein
VAIIEILRAKSDSDRREDTVGDTISPVRAAAKEDERYQQQQGEGGMGVGSSAGTSRQASGALEFDPLLFSAGLVSPTFHPPYLTISPS